MAMPQLNHTKMDKFLILFNSKVLEPQFPLIKHPFNSKVLQLIL